MREHDRQPDRPFDLQTEHDGSLSDLLDRCGHYYAHRIGGSRRGQDNVMNWLARHIDATQKEMGEELGITPASLSEVLIKLERKGHVERFKDEEDRRFVRVRLTRQGKAALQEDAHQQDDPFSALTSEEQETLTELLAKLLADWQVRYIEERKRSGGRPCHERPVGGRDFSRHGNEHPGHNNDHPGHGNEHPGHGRNERDDREGGRRGHH